MGLDAFVPCNCLKEGKTTPPPVERQWIELDDEGYYVLAPQYSADADLNARLDEWSLSCCPHFYMHISQPISNWAGLRAFKQALAKIGLENFPVLATGLPDLNGGRLEVEQARIALSELDKFKQKVKGLTNLYLIDAEKDQIIYEYIDAYEGKFKFSENYELGFNQKGFYILNKETQQIVFQAKKVSQIVNTYPNWLYAIIKWLNKKSTPVRQVCWKDLDTGICYYTSVGFSLASGDYPRVLIVEQRGAVVEEYDSITTSLEQIFKTALELGNPVFWY